MPENVAKAFEAEIAKPNIIFRTGKNDDLIASHFQALQAVCKHEWVVRTTTPIHASLNETVMPEQTIFCRFGCDAEYVPDKDGEINQWPTP